MAARLTAGVVLLLLLMTTSDRAEPVCSAWSAGSPAPVVMPCSIDPSDPPEVVATPEPTSFGLFGVGIIGLMMLARTGRRGN